MVYLELKVTSLDNVMTGILQGIGGAVLDGMLYWL